jgi:hypothetical protein
MDVEKIQFWQHNRGYAPVRRLGVPVPPNTLTRDYVGSETLIPLAQRRLNI